MNEFGFFLKRDMRMLVPVNIIIAIIFLIMLMVATVIRYRVAQPFESLEISIISLLLLLYIFFAAFFIIIESVWREWRLGTQFEWYLAPGSITTKLLAKVAANYTWLLIQILYSGLSLTLFTHFAASNGIMEEILLNNSVITEYPLQLLWILIISPLTIIFMTLLPVYLFLGLKVSIKYPILILYGLLTIIVYPYVSIQLAQSATTPLNEQTILPTFQMTSNEQILLDFGLLVALFFTTVYFLKKRVEL
ncbi:hypothetical protein DH09_19680 [Bacillaceae bacterium JMAK1]|nr:hypothetical protein DH09_19680 [Bacillaceae bacterium JMAK1]